jgi:oligosaccharyl transferase (archaeosortase A-associated)
MDNTKTKAKKVPFQFKFPAGAGIGLLIALFFAVALFIRVYFPYNQVFVGDWIKYTGNDAYYQMRLVDNMVFNFPHITAWDPYLIFPDGSAYGGIHFFNYLLAFVIWIFTLGSPTPRAVDVISVYFPAVLAALTVIPVYFIGKALFNRWAGVIAAGIMAVMPGEFLGRSILGGTDQHVAETLFITIAFMFAIYALKSGWQNQLSWSHIIRFDWKALRKPLIFSLLAGVFLGVYLLTWIGALFFVFIFVIYVILQVIIDHLNRQNSFYLGFTGFFIGLIGLVMFSPQAGYTSHKLALIIAMILPPVLAVISRFMTKCKLNIFYFPAALVILGGIFVFVFRLVDPTQFSTMVSQFASVFNPGGSTSATTIEMQPFLSPTGQFTTAIAYGNFTTSFFLIPWAAIPGIGIISFVVLVILFIKNRGNDKPMLLFFVWTLVMLIATLVQRRFAYYLVVNMALLSSYLCWQAIWWFSRRRYHLQNPETLREQYKRSVLVGILGGVLLFGSSFIWIKTMYFFIPLFILGLLSVFYGFWAWVQLKNKNEYMILWAFVFPIGALALALSKDESVKNIASKKAKEQPKEKTKPWLYAANIITLVLIVCVAVLCPNWEKAKGVAAAATYAPSDGWEETLHWLKNSTPDPMPAGSYNKLFSGPEKYPDTAYGVTAWWDYGYWITRTAHRLPSDNPSQSPEPIQKVANLFLSTTQQQERDIVKQLKSSYIVLDDSMTTTKIWAVATWAGIESDAFSSIFYYQGQGTQIIPIQVYDLEYYKLLSVRLFNFNGKASTSERPMVLTWEDKTTTSGVHIRLVTDAQEYDSYQSALNYVAANPDKKLYIAGSSPFINPIPIEAVTDYNLVFSSAQKIKSTDSTSSSTTKVFQYIGPK